MIFTQQAESYARIFSGMRPERAEEVKALIGDSMAHDVLEIACGPGTASLDLAAVSNHVTGVDLTPAMIQQARAAQAERGIANADWIVGDGAALPFPDSSFSLVVCRSAFHHLVDPKLVLREMVRVCRSGGRVAVSDVAPLPDKAAAYDALERMRDSSHVHAHPIEELRALAETLPLTETTSISRHSGNVPLEYVLETSFPVGHSIDAVRRVFTDDIGVDRLGLNARIEQDKVLLDYPMATIVWVRD